MFRLLGFVVGSIASIAALVMLVGMPSFHLGGEDSEDDRFDVVIQQLRNKQQNAASTNDPAAASASVGEASQTETAAEGPLQAANLTTDHSIVGQQSHTENISAEEKLALAPDPATESPSPAAEQWAEPAFVDTARDLAGTQPPEDVFADEPLPAEPGWQSFWNPFRSELAANGFVRRLENVTGLDYRVVRVKNGVYEVAFSYNDDDERSSKLTQIASATGLDLSDVGK